MKDGGFSFTVKDFKKRPILLINGIAHRHYHDIRGVAEAIGDGITARYVMSELRVWDIGGLLMYKGDAISRSIQPSGRVVLCVNGEVW